MIANEILIKFFKESGITVPDNFVYRISPQEALDAVLKYGSSRKGLSSMAWDRSLDYPDVVRKYGNLKHEDVVIASTYSDIWEDSFLSQGTLLHKLNIYKNPFITVYHKENLHYLCDESKNGPQNTGKNWIFLTDSRKALAMICQINDLNINKKEFNLKFIEI